MFVLQQHVSGSARPAPFFRTYAAATKSMTATHPMPRRRTLHAEHDATQSVRPARFGRQTAHSLRGAGEGRRAPRRSRGARVTDPPGDCLRAARARQPGSLSAARTLEFAKFGRPAGGDPRAAADADLASRARDEGGCLRDARGNQIIGAWRGVPRHASATRRDENHRQASGGRGVASVGAIAQMVVNGHIGVMQFDVKWDSSAFGDAVVEDGVYTDCQARWKGRPVGPAMEHRALVSACFVCVSHANSFGAFYGDVLTASLAPRS